RRHRAKEHPPSDRRCACTWDCRLRTLGVERSRSWTRRGRKRSHRAAGRWFGLRRTSGAQREHCYWPCTPSTGAVEQVVQARAALVVEASAVPAMAVEAVAIPTEPAMAVEAVEASAASARAAEAAEAPAAPVRVAAVAEVPTAPATVAEAVEVPTAPARAVEA